MLLGHAGTTIVLSGVCAMLFVRSAQGWAEATPTGWAGVAGETIGGGDIEPVDIRDADTLNRLAIGSTAKVLRIHGTIRLTDQLRVGSNTTLIGAGGDATIRGGGIHVRKVDNVVIRNLTITEAPDAVSIEESHHIWVDHCDLSKCSDGLVDIKRGSDYVTVSWNHFHDHRKTCLLGHSDKQNIRAIDLGHLRVTYHHNYFDGTQTRHPRVRFASPVHVYNNYYRDNEYGIAALMDSGVIVENNYFEDVEQPTVTQYGDSPDPGRLIERGNVYVRSGEAQTRGTVDESTLIYRYQMDPADKLPQIVESGCGVGKLEK
ncbi:MAG: right-handed parallel beta-helix repeat-containing protein [Pirellulaceae bacterium]